MTRSRTRTRPRTPVALAVPALLAIAFLLMPLLGILARTSWGELGTHLTSPDVTEALRLSLVVSFWALGLSLLLGVPLAWLLARVDFPGKALVRSLVLLPMVLPPTVGGVALLLGFGRRGLLGPWLEDTFGITLPFHTSGAVVAATFVAMPFLVISLEGALGGLRPALRGDRRLARRLPAAGLPHRDPAHGRAGPRRGRGAHLGPRARRVRRDHHLRRQPPRHHPDPARSRSTFSSRTPRRPRPPSPCCCSPSPWRVLVALRGRWTGAASLGGGSPGTAPLPDTTAPRSVGTAGVPARYRLGAAGSVRTGADSRHGRTRNAATDGVNAPELNAELGGCTPRSPASTC